MARYVLTIGVVIVVRTFAPPANDRPVAGEVEAVSHLGGAASNGPALTATGIGASGFGVALLRRQGVTKGPSCPLKSSKLDPKRARTRSEAAAGDDTSISRSAV